LHVIGVGATELRPALVADTEHLHVDASLLQLRNDLELDELDDLSVDTTTEALVGSDWDHDLGLGVEFDAVGVLLRLLNGPKKVLQSASEGTARLKASIGTAKFGGSNHLHRFGDLGDVADRLHAEFHLLHRTGPTDLLGLVGAGATPRGLEAHPSHSGHP